MKTSRRLMGVVLLVVVFATIAFWRMRREPTFKKPTQAQLQKFYPAGAQQVFENAPMWTLYSLEPHPVLNGKNVFHDYPILGETTVRDAATRARLQKALYGAVANAEEIASWFNPHHGVRATWRNRTVDLVVCFGCGTSYFYIGKERYDAAVAVDSRDANAAWNRVLESAGVALSRR